MHSVTLMGSSGFASLLILPGFSKHCSVTPALSVVRASLFPTCPLIVTNPSFASWLSFSCSAGWRCRPASQEKQQEILAIVQFLFLQGLFFTLQFWDAIVRNYSVLEVSGEVNPFILLQCFLVFVIQGTSLGTQLRSFDAQGMPHSCVVFNVTLNRTKGRGTVRNQTPEVQILN